MRRYTFTVFWMLAVSNAFGQRDTTIVSGIGINAGELINIIRTEFNLRVSYMQQFSKHYSMLIEPGIYFVGTGYNFKAEIKRYDIHLSKKHKGRDYIGIAMSAKNHFYNESVNFYSDTSVKIINTRSLDITRLAYTCNVILGWVTTGKLFYMEEYFGIGIRFKEISGITDAEVKRMEDNAGILDLQPGKHVLPNITAGIRLGLRLNKR